LCAQENATAKIVLLAPAGVVIRLDAAPGTALGRLSAKARVSRTAVDLPLRNGSIVAADPARFAHNPCAPGIHAAVWLLRTKTATGKVAINLPLYVDKIEPRPANGKSVYRLQMCLGSFNNKRRVAGWPAHTLFRSMNLLVNPSVVSERPTEPGAYVWHGLFTPFRTNGVPNAAGTVESRATQMLPVVWTLNGSYYASQHAAVLSGALTQGGQPVSGLKFVIWYGTALGGTFPGILNPKIDSNYPTTDGAGHFSATVPIAESTYFRASGGTVLLYVDRAGCTPPSIASKGCVSASQSGFATASPIVKVNVP
jgi:hypothetical protein